MDFISNPDFSRAQKIYQSIFPEKSFSYQDNQIFYLMSSQKSDVGFVHGIRIGDVFEIYDLGIVESMRSQGLGRQLLEKLFQVVQVPKVILEVSAQNKAASALYEAFDFKITSIRKSYYQDGADALLMEKIL